MTTQIQWQQALCAFQPGNGLLATPSWSDSTLALRLDNISGRAQVMGQWLLFDEVVATPDAAIYGEGFQMLAQSAGCWGSPEAVGRCPDASVYRISADQGYHTVHNLLLFRQGEQWQLLAFTRCERFGGEFRLYPDGRLQILMNTEGLSLLPGAHWDSESLVVLVGSDRAQLFTEFSRHINICHPPLPAQPRATGWCSWYHYYAEVTREAIEENLAQMTERFAALEFVQIDDGYQSARRKNSTPVGSKKAGNAGKMLTQHTGLPPRASDGSKPWDKREQAKAAAFAKLQEQKKNSGKGASGKKKPRPAVPR